MYEEMKDKVCLITGATSGIGKETAVLFAEKGIKVALAGRNEKQGEVLQKKIQSSGGQALFIKTDVKNEESVKGLIQQTIDTFGTIDYAVNNAGIEGKFDFIADFETEDYDDVMDTNLKGVFYCLKFQLKKIAEFGGAIVNVSTNLTKMGARGTGVYTASKAGVESMTRVAAVEYAHLGVRVNAVSPGAVETPMIERLKSRIDLPAIIENNPQKRIAQPKDIAHTILWLCSPMSGPVNGEVIFIDGGGSLDS